MLKAPADIRARSQQQLVERGLGAVECAVACKTMGKQGMRLAAPSATWAKRHQPDWPQLGHAMALDAAESEST